MYLSHKSLKPRYGLAHATFCGQVCTAITTFLDITSNLHSAFVSNVIDYTGYRFMLHKWNSITGPHHIFSCPPQSGWSRLARRCPH